MDPFTIGLMVAGTGLKAFGALSGAGSQANASVDAGWQSITEGQFSLTQAQLYGLNAEIAEGNVSLLVKQGEIADMGDDFAYAKARLQKGRISEQGRVVLAAQRAEFTSRNIDPTFGSPLVAQAMTASRIAQDLDLTDANAAVEAADAKTRAASIYGAAAGERGKVVSAIGAKLGAETKAASQFARSRALFSKSGDDINAGVIGAASALLTGAASIAGAGGGSGPTFQGNPWGAQSINVPMAGRDF